MNRLVEIFGPRKKGADDEYSEDTPLLSEVLIQTGGLCKNIARNQTGRINCS